LELPLSVYNDNIVNSLKNIKPLIITEWKTDVKILKTAWNKLYPNEECPFEIIESWLDNKSWSANVLKNQLNYATTYWVERTIIWLFDNDKEWNEQFKWLDKDIFEEYSIDKDIRKHNNSSIYGLLLQIPDFREKFISKTSINKRYFEIEHYFSDKLLKQHNILKEDDTLSNGIFEIWNSKNSFSESVNKFNKEEFKNFELMFNRIKKYI
jgi:hypothetical protein